MRSLLFIPGDSVRKLDKGLGAGADVLLVDLEDSVALSGKDAARRTAAAFLAAARREAHRPRLYVRVNGLTTVLTDADLDAVMPAGPDGIMLPKTVGGPDLSHLGVKLAVREAEHGLAVGAEANRGSDGLYTDPYRIARAMTLFAAAAAEADAIDSVYTNFRDLDGLGAECREARRDGFAAKMAIHPAQVAVINEAFTPSAEALAHARAIVDAFAQNPDAGVVGIDGQMIDRPHLRQAERVLERAAATRR